MSSTEQLARRFVETINDRDFDTLDAVLSPDLVAPPLVVDAPAESFRTGTEMAGLLVELGGVSDRLGCRQQFGLIGSDNETAPAPDDPDARRYPVVDPSGWTPRPTRTGRSSSCGRSRPWLVQLGDTGYDADALYEQGLTPLLDGLAEPPSGI